jgi:hypothetical protein
MLLPVKADINIRFDNPEHRVFLESFMNVVTRRAKPDRVNLDGKIAHLKSLFKIGKSESKILVNYVS